MELPKSYEPGPIEGHWYSFWEKNELFTAGKSKDITAGDNKKAAPFTLLIPPPNVTGVLHIGHALTCTLEDIIVRRQRMLGKDTLWVPGTDHAGIATQMVVERNLKKEKNLSRHDLGREKFLEQVWVWKEKSQGTILSQIRKIGASVDWTRLKFTLDPDLSRAVRSCFVDLYKEGLIYRGKSITQWCPRCQTALSDLEVKYIEVKGQLWHILYRFPGQKDKGLVVATTRPETLLGDTAVAVHPDNPKTQHALGKSVEVPLTGRSVPVISDSYVDIAFGTGALKVTPAHDPNDYEIALRHKLPMISIFDPSAKLNENVPSAYRNLSREKGREKILEDLEKEKLLIKTEDHVHSVGHCDRCNTRVEPYLSEQWFVNAEPLAKPAIEAVKTGKLKIIPQEWEKTWFNWLENIRPWCISRQLWWGHRIPVWYCQDCKQIICEHQDPTQCSQCKSKNLKQDEDVLDTWFSSGLWPLSTLGWPDKESADLKRYYPTQVMETGFDILFFWVARMVMLCRNRMDKDFPSLPEEKKLPFSTVYLHPMVRDEYGQKMSKTKGNVKDPLEIIEVMGADALRFTLASMAVHGRDVLLSDQRIQGYRNFINKIWNASRFVLLHFSDLKDLQIDRKNPVNAWIWTRLNRCKKEVNLALEEFRFFEAAHHLYHFMWNEYCDWFIELIKSPTDLEDRKKNKEGTAVFVLEEILRLLHPFIPFVTEELWQKLPLAQKQKSICVASYPQADPASMDEVNERKIIRLIEIVALVRSKRGENELKPDAKIHLSLIVAKNIQEELKPFENILGNLTGSASVQFLQSSSSQKGAVVVPFSEGTVLIPEKDLVDVEKLKAKSEKELEQAEGELERAEQKLKDPKFTGSAPASVVEGVKNRRDVLVSKVKTLKDYLKQHS